MAEIEKLTNLPNIYFDPMGTTRLYHHEWRTLVFVDLRDIKAVETTIREALNHPIHTEGNGFSPSLYGHMSNRFQRSFNHKNTLLTSLGYKKVERKRVKRGWLNPIGDLANILFGTLSQKDAQYYNSEIDKLYTDNKRLSVLIQNETTIVRSILKNNDIFEDKITTYVNKINNYTNANIERIYERTNTLELLLELSEIITEHNELIENLRSIVVNGEQGKIDPLLLEPDQLSEILRTIEQKYGSSRMMFSNTNEFAYKFLRIAKVNVFVLNSYKLCFELKIPIVEEEIYALYSMIPLPHITEDYIYLLHTQEQYILVERDSRSYSIISDRDIDHCIEISDLRICARHSPSLSTELTNPCIKRALHNLPADHKDCPAKMITHTNPIWIQLYSNQEWISASYYLISFHVSCKDSNRVISHHLNGVNKIKIKAGCIGHTASVTLYSSETINNHNELQLQLGLANITIPKLDDTVKAYARVPELRKELITNNDLKLASKSLDQIISEAHSISTHTRSISRNESTWMILQTLIGALGIIIGLYIFSKFKLWRLIFCLFKPCTRNNCLNINSNGTNHYGSAPQSVVYTANAPETCNLQPTPLPPEENKLSQPSRRKKHHVSFTVPPI
ncbi:uncharacterized protein LOC123989287 isoform X2 [Osmia bicornis bicornis]|nr:uncharacterized protein LOC123988626 [Osmia bicornis bicornis]XP_046146045.1 uncharacterized protein LOC123989287 isoform X2 [Osmia bicornis bicornis]